MINGDISIKSKNFEEKETILTGDFWCEAQSKSIVYDLVFPENIRMYFFQERFLMFKDDSLILENKDFRIEPSYWGYFLFNGNIEKELIKNGFQLKDVQAINELEDIRVYEFDKDRILIKKKNQELNAIVTLRKEKRIQQVIFNELTSISGYTIPSEIFNIQSHKTEDQKQWIKIRNLEISNDFSKFESLLDNTY